MAVSSPDLKAFLLDKVHARADLIAVSVSMRRVPQPGRVAFVIGILCTHTILFSRSARTARRPPTP